MSPLEDSLTHSRTTGYPLMRLLARERMIPSVRLRGSRRKRGRDTVLFGGPGGGMRGRPNSSVFRRHYTRKGTGTHAGTKS